MLPMLMEEFQNVLLSYRLRGKAPEANGIVGKIKYLIYQSSENEFTKDMIQLYQGG